MWDRWKQNLIMVKALFHRTGGSYFRTQSAVLPVLSVSFPAVIHVAVESQHSNMATLYTGILFSHAVSPVGALPQNAAQI